jgi:hypothetical protein
VKETSDTASGAAGKTSAGERNKRCRERHCGQDVYQRKKRATQRAAQRVRRQQEKETSDAASGTAGKREKGAILPHVRQRNPSKGKHFTSDTAVIVSRVSEIASKDLPFAIDKQASH